MSLILMRTKVDHLNAWWEPHATSTPLKNIPVQLEIKHKAQKQVVEQTDSINLLGKFQNAFSNFDILQNQPPKTKLVDSKRNRKNRLSTYFDPSSSDDDSGEIKRRPIIKLNSKENRTKILLRNKEPQNEEMSTVNISPSRNLHKNLSIRNSMKTRKNISALEKSKNQNDQVQNGKNKAQIETENTCPDSDEENQILTNCKKNQSFLKENKAFLKKKVNSVNYSRSDENPRHPSDFNEIERKKLKKISKANEMLIKPKQIKRSTTKNSQTLRSYHKMNTINNKLSKFHKMKSKKIIDSADPLKNQIKKSVSKNVKASALKQTGNTVNPLLLENKSNLSHQLFSESTEQEYINVLDLTSDEANEGMENIRCSVQGGRNSVCQPFTWPYHSSHRTCIENKDKERPKRKKQTPVKHWTPKNQSPELTVTTAEKEAKSVENLPKNDNQIWNVKFFTNTEETLKGKKTENNCKIKTRSFKNHNDQNETKQELINVTENEAAADGPKSENYKNQLVSNGVLNCSSSSPEINFQRDEAHVKDTLRCAQEKSTVDSSVKSVFKQLDELSFNANGSGCSAVQCWSVNNVKCGVFKLKMKSQFACQTLHSNSYLGGVLVKGRLRMKIGIKEQDLKEGDMAFVPPLTEWRATNIGECESVFYYWCGRFGS